MASSIMDLTRGKIGCTQREKFATTVDLGTVEETIVKTKSHGSA